MNTIKSALISIPVIVVSMMISCNKVDVPTEEVPDDEIIA